MKKNKMLKIYEKRKLNKKKKRESIFSILSQMKEPRETWNETVDSWFDEFTFEETLAYFKNALKRYNAQERILKFGSELVGEMINLMDNEVKVEKIETEKKEEK